MKFRGLVVAAVVACAVGWAGRSVFSGDEPKAPPDMGEMMKLMAPGEEHARLAKVVGDWTVHGKFYFGPAPMESDGTSTFKAIMGGRYIEQTYTSTFMGMPFEGRGVMGYDNAAKKYVSSWIDNHGTGIMHLVGTETVGKVWTYTGTHNMGQGDDPIRHVVKMVSDNEFTYTGYRTRGGKEGLTMELTYKRK